MRGILAPEALQELTDWLGEVGLDFTFFEGPGQVKAAISDPNTKLLFVGIDDDELPSLTETLRAGMPAGSHIPVLVLLKQCPATATDKLLVPEIDDFILGPVNLPYLRLRITKLLQRTWAGRGELSQTEQNLMKHFGMRHFIGTSAAFLSAVEKIPRVADCDATALVIGETGTGKELCARAIHYLSARSSKPFIPVNCGSIPADLFENEMFGHEPGAFTDARRTRRGMIAEAEGGTLFLDEVDSLPLSAQVKLLRFLQDRQYRPLGATSYRQANVRLIAASNKNLLAKVQEGLFREDLYYRLNVVSLWLPSLQERKEDIMLLATHFLKKATIEYKRPANRFSHDAILKLNSYSWPGNVRELENVVYQAVVLSTEPVLRAQQLHLSSDKPVAARPPARESLKRAKARVVESFERDYLLNALLECNGNISEAARRAQKDRRSFFTLLKKYNLTTPYGAGQELAAQIH